MGTAGVYSGGTAYTRSGGTIRRSPGSVRSLVNMTPSLAAYEPFTPPDGAAQVGGFRPQEGEDRRERVAVDLGLQHPDQQPLSADVMAGLRRGLHRAVVKTRRVAARG
jgi:hypothetical protein